MSRHPALFTTVAAASLTLLAASAAFGAALDPHQQAREAIVPPAVATPAPPTGAMGRIIEFTDGLDGYARAQQTLRPEPLSARSTPFRGAADAAASGTLDPHQRARQIIGNRD